MTNDAGQKAQAILGRFGSFGTAGTRINIGSVDFSGGQVRFGQYVGRNAQRLKNAIQKTWTVNPNSQIDPFSEETA